jgi:hypothetical protein
METVLNDAHLNEQQMDMIRLLRKPMPEKYFQELRRVAVQLLNKQLDETIDNWEKQNNLTEADYEKRSKEHYRTPYKKQQ